LYSPDLGLLDIAMISKKWWDITLPYPSKNLGDAPSVTRGGYGYKPKVMNTVRRVPAHFNRCSNGLYFKGHISLSKFESYLGHSTLGKPQKRWQLVESLKMAIVRIPVSGDNVMNRLKKT